MRLAIDCRELSPHRVTGIGRFLGGALEEIVRHRGHLHTLALGEPGTALPLDAPHLELHRLPLRPALYWDQILLPRVLRALRPDFDTSSYILRGGFQ